MALEIQTPIIQRPLRGSRISTFYPVKSLPALSSLDSAFQLQEYISLLIRLDVHDVETITSLPGSQRDVKERDREGAGGGGGSNDGDAVEKGEQEGAKEGAGVGLEGEKTIVGDERDVNVDEACWIYEQLRRLAQDLTHPLITTLQQECSRTTCPEMKAGEWLYLCVAHGTEGAMEQCCAIDYILHTLDSATALLNSPRAFPSRLQIPPSSNRHFSSLARRLGRIFAHAYFHHREAFEQAEAESSLYARFLSLTSKYDLVPSEFLVIPPRASATGVGVGVGSGSGGDSDEEDGGVGGVGGDERGGISGGGSGFGLREVKLGTSYDPRRSGGGGSQHQLPSSFQDEFPDVPRTRRLPQQYQQYSHQLHLSQSQSHYQHQHQQQQQSQPQLHQQQQQKQSTSFSSGLEPSPLGGIGGSGGADSPRKTGRNRTHTMILSEAASVVDDLAKAAAAAAAKAEEEEKERKEKEEKEKEKEQEQEAKAREEVEREQWEKDDAEAEAKAKAKAEGESESEGESEVEEELTGEQLKEVDEGEVENDLSVEEKDDEEKAGESEGGEGEGEVGEGVEGAGDGEREEESAVEAALLASADQEPSTKEEPQSSQPEEPAEIPVKATAEDKESGAQEVDIAEGASVSATETSEASTVPEGEHEAAAEIVTSDGKEAETDVTSSEEKEDSAQADAEEQKEEAKGDEKEAS